VDCALTLLLILPFEGTSLWVIIFFLKVISVRKEVFFRKIWVGWGEILSVDSDLNKNTSLKQIKTGLPWIEPTTSNLGDPWTVPVRAHKRKDIFKLGVPVWCQPKTLERVNQ